MDPDVLLEQILNSAMSIREAVEGTDPRAIADITVNADELADSILDLNDWLSKGGFLPLAWQNFGGQKQ